MTIATAYARLTVMAIPHPPCGGKTVRLAGTRRGYIQLDIGGGTRAYIHRIAWEAHHGAIPEGMHVLHRCDQPPCFEIRHLFLGSIADNNADRDMKGRGVVPDTRGERHGNHKLTEDEVRAIRSGRESGVDASARYGVSRSTISKIRAGDAWRHVK